MQKNDVAAFQIAEKCVELANLATLHGLQTLSMILRMGALEARECMNVPITEADLPTYIPPCVVGTWDWDVASNKLYANEEFAEFYSVDPRLAAAGAPIELFIAAIHPLDRERVSEGIYAAIQTGEGYEVEYRVVGRDQAVRWVRARGRCWRDKECRPLHFPGSVVDITYEKRIRAA
jgi:PAS domain-containing protein